MAILKAPDIARYFLAKQGQAATAEPITNMKLQKLCYYAQGVALAKLRRPLFSDDIEHWQHGPVVPALWREYKGFGASPIPPPQFSLDLRLFDADTRRVLDSVLETYGRLSAWDLRNMTHAEPPWQDTPDSSPITHQKMRSYFIQLMENMPIFDENGMEDPESPSLAFQMTNDAEFMALTGRGLDALAQGRYSSLEDFRKSLGNI